VLSVAVVIFKSPGSHRLIFLQLLLSVLFSFVVSIVPEAHASKLNVILAVGYQGLYLLVNLLLIVPPHRRYNKLKAELVKKQEAQTYTKSGRFKPTLKGTLSFGETKKSLKKSYSLSGGTMALRGDDSFNFLKAGHDSADAFKLRANRTSPPKEERTEGNSTAKQTVEFQESSDREDDSACNESSIILTA
jgi:hypothetical protein